MAEAPSTVADSGLKELQEELTCAVCHNILEEPKILPCCHYYCKKCIQDLLEYAGRTNQPFECPECRAPTLVPQNDPNQLTTAFFVNRLKELRGKMEKAHGKVEALCEQCSGGVSIAFCRQCAEFICGKCVESHQRMKVFTGHKVVTLEELKTGEAKQILVSKPPPPKCPTHDEPMKAYCFDCSQLICRDCIAINHAGHKSEFTKVAAPETKKQLAEHLQPLKDVQANLCKAVDSVQAAKSEISSQGTTIAENIEQSFQELHKIIELHKNRLLVEASMKVQEKCNHLSSQEKRLNTESAAIQSLVDFVEQNVSNVTDEELMMMHEQILSRIDEVVKKEHRKEIIDLQPIEEADIGLEIGIAEHLEKACVDKAKIFTLPADPSQCKVDDRDLNTVEVNQQTHILVHTMLHNGAPTKKPQKVTAELKSLIDESVTQLEAVWTEENMYNIQFSSAVRGHHQLAVSVNDQPIAGSPFPLDVKISPTQLGMSLKVISGLDDPYAAAVNSAEEVLVTERMNIAVFNKNGKKLYTIKMPTDDINPRGIAVDRDDNIYVTDSKRHCLLKMNRAGKVLRTVGSKGKGSGKFNVPLHLSVVRDRVIVCDSKNERLQVFSKESLNYIGTIRLHNRTPVGIAYDEQGSLYVSDPKTSSVMVLNELGELLLTFCKKDDGLLNGPDGVCVDDQFVYVVEYWGHCVSVFSRDGQFVTSFSKPEESSQQEFMWPVGICVGSDGSVYICDC